MHDTRTIWLERLDWYQAKEDIAHGDQWLRFTEAERRHTALEIGQDLAVEVVQDLWTTTSRLEPCGSGTRRAAQERGRDTSRLLKSVVRSCCERMLRSLHGWKNTSIRIDRSLT